MPPNSFIYYHIIAHRLERSRPWFGSEEWGDTGHYHLHVLLYLGCGCVVERSTRRTGDETSSCVSRRCVLRRTDIAATQLTTSVSPCAPDAAGHRKSQARRGKKEGARGIAADAREARTTTTTARAVPRVARPPDAFTRKTPPRGTGRPAAQQHAARVRLGRKSFLGTWRSA